MDKIQDVEQRLSLWMATVKTITETCFQREGQVSDLCPQTATPTNTSGVTGDKPIETLGDVGKTALTGGTSTVLKQAANAVGISGTSTAAADKAAAPATGSACADGSCAVK